MTFHTLASKPIPVPLHSSSPWYDMTVQRPCFVTVHPSSPLLTSCRQQTSMGPFCPSATARSKEGSNSRHVFGVLVKGV